MKNTANVKTAAQISDEWDAALADIQSRFSAGKISNIQRIMERDELTEVMLPLYQNAPLGLRP